MKLKFEWDEKKNAMNKRKHGISFEMATRIFSDPKRTEILDLEHSIFEVRWKAVGLSNCDIMTVIYTERNGIIRLISARKADNIETEEYFYGYS